MEDKCHTTTIMNVLHGYSPQKQKRRNINGTHSRKTAHKKMQIDPQVISPKAKNQEKCLGNESAPTPRPHDITTRREAHATATITSLSHH